MYTERDGFTYIIKANVSSGEVKACSDPGLLVTHWYCCSFVVSLCKQWRRSSGYVGVISHRYFSETLVLRNLFFSLLADRCIAQSISPCSKKTSYSNMLVGCVCPVPGPQLPAQDDSDMLHLPQYAATLYSIKGIVGTLWLLLLALHHIVLLIMCLCCECLQTLQSESNPSWASVFKSGPVRDH